MTTTPSTDSLKERTAYKHEWVKSSLGHGETMCRKCKATNREAAALGMTECDVPSEPDGDFGEALNLLRGWCGLFFGRNGDMTHMDNETYRKAHTKMFMKTADWLRAKGFVP